MFDAVVVEQKVKNVSLEEFISRGLELREKKDNINWELGDLASDVTYEFGPKFLSDFSKGIGIEVSTIKRYRDVSRAYSKEIREKFKMLSWTHFRLVAAQENREELLEKAADETWSVEKLAMSIKPQSEASSSAGQEFPPEMEKCPHCEKWRFVSDVQLCPNDGRCEFENR